MATRKTLIRNERHHEVTLVEGEHLAQSAKVQAQDLEAPPAIARKQASSSPRPASRASADNTPAPAPAAAPARKKARLGTGEGAAPAAKGKSTAASKPRLPAHVPADRLWEEDSAVMQRLHLLQQQNARLTEQLQKLQSPAPLKGFQP